MERVEFRRQVPLVGEYDLVVAGGGMAGVSAAVAAARRGARTLLVERLEQLGGLGSSGGVGNFSYHGGPPIAQGGVFDDIWQGLRSCHALGEEHGFPPTSSPHFYNQPFDHAVLPIVLEELVLAAGAELLYGTDVIGARVDSGRVTEAILQNRSLDQAVRATVFLDATGDGILSRHAGARTLPLAESEHPELIKPSAMIFLVRKGSDHEVELPNRERDHVPDYSLWSEPHRIALKMRLFHCDFDTGTGRGTTDAVIAFRRQIAATVAAFRSRGGRLDGSEAGAGIERPADFTFGYAAPMMGLRESRRVEGDYALTGADVRAGRKFADSVCYGKSVLDSHRYREIVPPYQIPYRSLLVRGIENLCVAGRCFSCERLALSSARVMATASLMGQACGVAAALAVRARAPIRAVGAREVREQLIASDSRPQEMRRFLDPEAAAAPGGNGEQE